MRTWANQRRTKLPQRVICKAPGLLPMLYKVREIAKELDVAEPTIRHWLETGAPFERDSRGHLWVNGEKFARWVNTQRKQKKSRKLQDDEGYCFRCKKVVKLNNPEIVPIKGMLIHIRGSCAECGGAITRGGRYDQSK